MTETVILSLAAMAYGNLVNLAPQRLHQRLYVPLNLLAGTGLGAAGYWWLDLDLTTVGLAPGAVALELMAGVAVGLGLAAPLFLVLLVPQARRLLADQRAAGLSRSDLAYRTLVRIPLGTAVFEEWVFRGILYGAWLEASQGNLATAFFGSSVAFGLWHIVPTLNMLRVNRPTIRPTLAALLVACGVLVTTIGGILLAELRLLTSGITAPFIAHGLINSLALVATYMAHRTSNRR